MKFIQSKDFQVNQPQSNTSSFSQSDDQQQVVTQIKLQKQNDNTKQGWKIKIVINKQTQQQMKNQQLQNKVMPKNQQNKKKGKKSSLTNQFSVISEDNQLGNNLKKKNKSEQHHDEKQENKNISSNEQLEKETLEAQQNQQFVVNEVNDINQNPLSNQPDRKQQSQNREMGYFQGLLNILEMKKEEYDNIKQSFPEIPPNRLPSFLFQQKLINKVLQKQKQQSYLIDQNQQQMHQHFYNYQQQPNNQFIFNYQDQYEQFQNQQQLNSQHQQNQKQEQQEQPKFLEIEFKYNTQLSDENLECAICTQSYTNGDKLAILLCIHRFHLNCISKWSQKSSQCPICHHG